jgi:hypothetical protein
LYEISEPCRTRTCDPLVKKIGGFDSTWVTGVYGFSEIAASESPP